MTTNESRPQESIAAESDRGAKRLHLPMRETISIAETIDVSNADVETKEDIQKIAAEYEQSFRKRCKRLLAEDDE